MFKKGDIAALITTTVTHYDFGTGRAPEKSHDIRIVRVASATKDGRVKKYQTHKESPVYPADTRCAREKYMSISGENQDKARRLFESKSDSWDLRFNSQEAAKSAIRGA